MNKEFTVVLTKGYEVSLGKEEDFAHLFNAIIGEVMTGYDSAGETNEQAFGTIFNLCICELHFVAGQLLQLGEQIDMLELLEGFRLCWDQLAEQVNCGPSDRD